MVQLLEHGPLFLLVVGVLAVLGTARATRLWVFDMWPPVRWLRARFLSWAEQTHEVEHQERYVGGIRVPGATHPELTWRAGWAPLATCPFCVAPWFALGSLAWAWASGLTGPWGTAWVALHVWFTVSYLAAMTVVRDEGEDD